MGIIAPRLKGEANRFPSFRSRWAARAYPEAWRHRYAQLLEDLADLSIVNDLKPSLPAFDELQLRLIIYLIFEEAEIIRPLFERGKI